MAFLLVDIVADGECVLKEELQWGMLVFGNGEGATLVVLAIWCVGGVYGTTL